MCSLCVHHQSQLPKLPKPKSHRIILVDPNAHAGISSNANRHHGGGGGVFCADVVDERTDYASQPLEVLFGDLPNHPEPFAASRPVHVDLLLNARVVDAKKKKKKASAVTRPRSVATEKMKLTKTQGVAASPSGLTRLPSRSQLDDGASEADLESEFDVLSELGSAFSEVDNEDENENEDAQDWEYLDLDFELRDAQDALLTRKQASLRTYADAVKT